VKTIIEKFSGETQGRIHHGGMVSFLQGQEILQNSDVLISIGNRDSDMVPSKTFEYMSYCKPIIHFYTFKEDPVISTLSQYPVALLLDTNGPIQSLVEQTKEFLSTYSKMSVEPKIIRELLYENTPEFSIDLIEGFFAQ
jgi:thiamine pyrophosphate-dependent acetolactate synthase large subunit-like protein